MKTRVLILFLFLFLSIGQAFSFINVNGLSIQKRFDHQGGISGYYLGDVAAFGGKVYNRMWKGGYAKNIGDYGSYSIVDYDSGDVFYNIGQTVLRFGNGLKVPYSLASTEDGLVFIGDIGANQIISLMNTGSVLQLITNINFTAPMDIYINNNTVFVINNYESKVYCFNMDLTPLAGISSFNITELPVAVSADSSYVYVLTSDSVLKYQRSGKFVSSYPIDYNINPADLDVDFYRNTYILDKTGYVHKYDTCGNYVCTLLNPGQGDYQIQNPTGMFIQDGNLTVFDEIGMKIYSISANVINITTTPQGFLSGASGANNTINYSLSEDGWVTIEILDANSNPIKLLMLSTYQQAGNRQINWDGKDDSGNPLTPGTYSISIQVQEQYASFNTDVKTTPIQIKAPPSVNYTWLSSQSITVGNSLLALKFNVSDPMNVDFSIQNDKNSYHISTGSYQGDGLSFYNYVSQVIPDGFYQAVLSGTTADGYTCQAQTNIIIHNFPLSLQVVNSMAGFNPNTSNEQITLIASEDASIIFSLPDGTVLYSSPISGGSNTITWNGKTTNGNLLADGTYNVNVILYLANIDSAQSEFKH